MSPMMRLALPVLAAASTAYAACSTSGTATIQNQGDASAIASCSTFSGNIAIATSYSGNLALDGVQVIKGDLTAEDNPNLGQLSGDSVTSIQNFNLQNVTGLNTVTFPLLTSVKTLKWISASVLQNLNFNAEISQAQGVDIENTILSSLEGINLETVGDVKIVNNRFIESIEMKVTNITGALVFEGNAPALAVKLNSLKAANNLTFQACKSVEVASLATLNDSLVLLKNTFESFSAPNLTKIGNSLIVNDNANMTNLTFPALTTISKAIQVANNTEFTEFEALPKLKTVGANLDIHGNFSKLEIPSLTDVTGAFNIQSTGDIQSTCDNDFKALKSSQHIQGKYQCIGEVSNPGGLDSTPTATGSGSKKTGAASPLNVQTGALGLGVFAAIFL
ncbi:GPI-anchored cell wall organization protein Ecm33 [Pleomassaria siparia CBS 279.74]|uniref:GPI-anchored cell wall organization protein Ecm33 n=1 Tax=Pleomassaria siparia CBS 279.74 TaxID=1314801 RepID=A0A6G1K3V7_9PLEO|nr:GPI-anchored cell wall organization protein Ecm33 [Pleomassaria siparia CBS 279.74]